MTKKPTKITSITIDFDLLNEISSTLVDEHFRLCQPCWGASCHDLKLLYAEREKKHKRVRRLLSGITDTVNRVTGNAVNNWKTKKENLS